MVGTRPQFGKHSQIVCLNWLPDAQTSHLSMSAAKDQDARHQFFFKVENKKHKVSWNSQRQLTECFWQNYYNIAITSGNGCVLAFETISIINHFYSERCLFSINSLLVLFYYFLTCSNLVEYLFNYTFIVRSELPASSVVWNLVRFPSKTWFFFFFFLSFFLFLFSYFQNLYKYNF